jgi:hypothetical protein
MITLIQSTIHSFKLNWHPKSRRINQQAVYIALQYSNTYRAFAVNRYQIASIGLTTTTTTATTTSRSTYFEPNYY